jgi:hypothetical protein
MSYCWDLTKVYDMNASDEYILQFHGALGSLEKPKAKAEFDLPPLNISTMKREPGTNCIPSTSTAPK